MATELPASEKAWSPWDSRRAEPLPPPADVVTVEMGSDKDDDDVQPPPLDAPELNLDEDVAGGNSTELSKDGPGDGGVDGAVDASHLAPPTDCAQGASEEGGLALGQPAHAPSTDGVAETPAATATAPPAIPMAAEGHSLAVAAVHLSGQGASSSGNPSEGHAIFAQARLAIHQMQEALDACQEGLRTREAEVRAREDEVRAREEEVARAEAAFREGARQAAERLYAREAGIATEAQRISRLREELRVTEDRLAAERRSLVTREAEVEGRHQKQLAAQAQVLRSELKLELDGALAKQAQEYDIALDKQEQATKALREELSQALDYSA